jgi:hypothetical protein
MALPRLPDNPRAAEGSCWRGGGCKGVSGAEGRRGPAPPAMRDRGLYIACAPDRGNAAVLPKCWPSAPVAAGINGWLP